MSVAQTNFKHILHGRMSVLNPIARRVYSYLLVLSAPSLGMPQCTCVTTSQEIQEMQGISRNQVNYALKTLRNQGLIQTESSQGRAGMTVAINRSMLGFTDNPSPFGDKISS